MPTGPRIQYFLSDHNEPVHIGNPIWNASFPLYRNHTPAPAHPDRQMDLCYGDYFTAVHTFLEKDRCRILTLAASECLNKRIVPADIKSIHIHLEKHGAFYHPSRIEVTLDASPLNFVLNVAVSEVGQRNLSREYSLIRLLNRKFKWPYLPKVYGLETIETRNGILKLPIPMFLGEWFDGFYEFHITSDDLGRSRIVVWDPRKGNIDIPEDTAPLIYEKTAEILTCYYDPCTFEQIHPWSHAAGDFILDPKDMEMRLISVRNFAPIVNFEEQDARSILEALLVFLLNLSILNRLDRSNGVGDMVWAEDYTVQATLNGFFSGLKQIETPDLFSEPLIRFFKPYLLARSENDLMEICAALSNRYPVDAPEVRLIKNNMKDHIVSFHRFVQKDSGI